MLFAAGLVAVLSVVSSLLLSSFDTVGTRFRLLGRLCWTVVGRGIDVGAVAPFLMAIATFSPRCTADPF